MAVPTSSGNPIQFDNAAAGKNITVFSDAIRDCEKVHHQVLGQMQQLNIAHQGPSATAYQKQMNTWLEDYGVIVKALSDINGHVGGAKQSYETQEDRNMEIAMGLNRVSTPAS